MHIPSFAKLVISIGVSQLAGLIGSLATAGSVRTWYTTLVRPALNPPSWVFGPVWTTLYTLMGIAAFLVWRKGWKHRAVRIALSVFGLQLVLNTLWSIVFFEAESPRWAFATIVLLWLSILWTMVLFYRLSKPAMYLLVPYILWVSFAAYLNFAIWMLN